VVPNEYKTPRETISAMTAATDNYPATFEVQVPFLYKIFGQYPEWPINRDERDIGDGLHVAVIKTKKK
jgi:hypothetical protein